MSTILVKITSIEGQVDRQRIFVNYELNHTQYCTNSLAKNQFIFGFNYQQQHLVNLALLSSLEFFVFDDFKSLGEKNDMIGGFKVPLEGLVEGSPI